LRPRNVKVFVMPDKETPAARYGRLARESLDAANTFLHGEIRDGLLQMAEVWQALADQYANSTPSLTDAPQQPVMQQQQQQQIQSKHGNKS
jgi:hypothetical protein